ncbi:MAG: hypothetical protein JW910_04010 [Anaerolineae bacterium]|nr:hypothetical protein [Anaerolineae bacterium]
MLKLRIRNTKAERGQGLVEYALMLSLAAAAVIAVLAIMGPRLNGLYCGVVTDLTGETPAACQVGGEDQGGGDDDGGGDENQVVITHANYSGGNHQVTLQATYNGGSDASVTLTASPGGQMSIRGDHYQLQFRISGDCPCTITVTASTGESDSVVVGE